MSSKAFSLSFTVLALVIGVFVGTASASFWISGKARATGAHLHLLEQKNAALQEKAERLAFIDSLAVEFGISPTIVATVDEYARQYVDPSQPEWRLIQTPEFMTHLMLSIIYTESKGDPQAVGDHGKARGLTQIWLSTAQQYGPVTAEQLLEPEVNVKYSFEHFQYLLKRYRGNLAMALYSWNRGQGTVDRLLRYGQTPNNGYGHRVYKASLAAGDAGLSN